MYHMSYFIVFSFKRILFNFQLRKIIFWAMYMNCTWAVPCMLLFTLLFHQFSFVLFFLRLAWRPRKAGTGQSWGEAYAFVCVCGCVRALHSLCLVCPHQRCFITTLVKSTLPAPYDAVLLSAFSDSYRHALKQTHGHTHRPTRFRKYTFIYLYELLIYTEKCTF